MSKEAACVCLFLMLLLGVFVGLFLCLVSPISWSLTLYVDQDQTHRYLPISASPVLSLKVCATMPGQGNVCFKSFANGQALKKDLITHQPPLCSHLFPLHEPTIYNTVFRLDCLYLSLPLEPKILWPRPQAHRTTLGWCSMLFSMSSSTSVPTSIT